MICSTRSIARRGTSAPAVRARCGGPVAVAVLAVWAPQLARALEPRSSSEPDVLREPAAITRVVDAWDGSGAMDLHFTLGYDHRWKRATISRELPTSAGPSKTRQPVASFAENTSRLDVRAELGLYRDLGLILTVPIVLSRSATLGSRGAPPGALDGAPGSPLFSLPSVTPNRSGVEYLGVGVDWGILNQGRDGALPSLLVGAEARFSVTEAMHACGPVPPAEGQTRASMRCTYPSDINRNGVGGEYPVELSPGSVGSLEGDLPSEPRRAGVSRGTTAFDLHTAISRRISNIEPYFALGLSFELPTAGSDFAAQGSLDAAPPIEGRASVGAELMVWELVEQFQRLSIDTRLTGRYRSEGVDYSELFDSLGSSGAIEYRRPTFAGYVENPDAAGRANVPSVVDSSSRRVFPTGLANIEAHGAYALSVAVRWQAGQYVHFDAGGALAFTQSHIITLGQPCDPSRSVAPAEAGPCASGGRVLGAPDPSYRPETDQPGQRFVVDTARSIDTWVGATVMF
ncbi:MAG TPA: hypothetical protein VNN80_32360 [Polyangiaceae bacterium]|nr:hypothetical protein [Polyangiaceae bacterium]